MTDTKTTVAETMPVAETAAAPKPKVSLDEWCRIKSKSLGKKVEMLSGFRFSEKAAGRVRDTAENYSQRYEEFVCAEVPQSKPEVAHKRG